MFVDNFLKINYFKMIYRNVVLNGEILEMKSEEELPQMTAKKSTSSKLNFHSYSMSFWVIPDAGAPTCHD